MVRKSVFFSFAALAMATAIFLLSHSDTAAAKIDQPSTNDVLNHFSTGTGFTKDALEVFFETDQKGLEQAQRYLLALDVLNKLYNAQDSEAFMALMNEAWNQARGQIFKKILSNAAQSVVAAVKLYWDALQLLRKYVLVPELDERVYTAYAELRGYSDRTVNLPAEAFERLSHGTWKNWTGVTYFALRDKMLDELIKAKGYNKSIMSKTHLDALKKELDVFWQRKLEGRYQREVFRRDWPKIKAALEAEGKAIEKRIRLSQPDVIRAALVSIPRDRPKNAYDMYTCQGKRLFPVKTTCQALWRGYNCRRRFNFVDKPNESICKRNKPVGFVYYRVSCAHSVFYADKPGRDLRDTMNVAGKWTVPGHMRVPKDHHNQGHELTVHYRSYRVSIRCRGSRRRWLENGGVRDEPVPKLGPQAIKFYIRKALPLIDRLYEKSIVR